VSPNSRRRPAKNAAANTNRFEVSTLPRRRTPLQELLQAVGDTLHDARAELVSREHDVFLEIVTAIVAAENARKLNAEWRAAA
jgi:hypothetical protein